MNVYRYSNCLFSLNHEIYRCSKSSVLLFMSWWHFWKATLLPPNPGCHLWNAYYKSVRPTSHWCLIGDLRYTYLLLCHPHLVHDYKGQNVSCDYSGSLRYFHPHIQFNISTIVQLIKKSFSVHKLIPKNAPYILIGHCTSLSPWFIILDKNNVNVSHPTLISGGYQVFLQPMPCGLIGMYWVNCKQIQV